MSGSTVNETILAGLNQIIAAINALELSSTCPAPEVAVTVRPNITVNCTCSGGGGTKIEDPPINATDPPPEGSEPDPNITSRECKAANYVFFQVRATVNILKVNNVDQMGTAGFVAAVALVGALFGTPELPLIGTIIGGIAGAIVALVISIINGGISLGDMLTVLDNNKDELVCALYEQAISPTGSTQAAKDNFLSICNTGGMSTPEYYTTSLMIPHDFLKVLFQAVGDSEAILDGYSPAGMVDCGGCGVSGYEVYYGTENLPGLQSITSVCHPSNGCLNQFIYISFTEPVTLNSLTVLSGNWGGGVNNFQYGDSSGAHYDTNFSVQSGVDWLQLAYNDGTEVPYTVDIDWSVD